ncbi:MULTISPECIES: patatin-like phospholipase family protein [unclassified Herbaspirillum]|uniref:patatin-like phospholipase family protein n=1 Tax=unclassified Herbaspirillum TaxID=2624150 RepID=UPI000E2EE332|nr:MULTISPECIES: patatin-like phospholipase family protein [unclassified Herbaspirillum]RFB65604.1 patatin-like phospholipase family protein [Herbaspirillum sp. 3R-3a1]TFI09094.1 patatin-like phospholipase family protein [Herbaspirillum sp. 3R11]TFI15512.1 patatin-like phospholipase family protein [Herbaspirillum sp. 3R-11]TFI20972.1 patatin-like phospholipase family protein [Herbaspirillum sp. 3C11]
MESTDKKTGLILTGGGARAAYQVGVLNAVSMILLESGWPGHQNPFKIICGTSAGAINATALACRADDFGEGVRELVNVWSNFEVEQVYRADSLGVIRSGARWLSLFSFGWLLRKWRANPPNSLLDNTPLVTMLHRLLDLPRLDDALASGNLHALAVTASSYTGGQHLTFYQSMQEIEPWSRTQRGAIRDQIGVEHLLASSAIPFIFPAIPIFYEGRREYFGDGSMRQVAPISPAIHLGASKILVIGAGRMGERSEAPTQLAQYPSLAQVAGHALSSIFLDGLAADIERTNRVNQTLSMLTPEQRAKTPLKPIEVLVISPSERIDEIASRHVNSLPRPVRVMLGGIGATEVRGAALASYLLFERSFTQELISLGERDTYAMRDQVLAFFEPERIAALQA